MSAAVMVPVVALLLISNPGKQDASSYDYWVYSRSGDAFRIVYNGDPIRFLPGIGDGAFDRPIRVGPARRFVFMTSDLTIGQVRTIMTFWNDFSPRTPTEFIVVSERSYFALPRYLDIPKVPGELLAKARQSSSGVPEQVGLCAGQDANIRCVRKNFEAMATNHEDDFWVILRRSAPKPEVCSPDSATVEFLALVGVQTGNAEFQEYFAGVVERLCFEAPACIRKAAEQLDAATLQRLRNMLANPVTIEHPDAIAKAKCLPEAR